MNEDGEGEGEYEEKTLSLTSITLGRHAIPKGSDGEVGEIPTKKVPMLILPSCTISNIPQPLEWNQRHSHYGHFNLLRLVTAPPK